MTRQKPVTVVVRHPDYSDDIHTFGMVSEVIYLDLGNSFDVTKLGEGSWEDEELREWIRYAVGEAERCGNDEAREYVLSTLREVVLNSMNVEIVQGGDEYTFVVHDRGQWDHKAGKRLPPSIIASGTGEPSVANAIDAFVAWAETTEGANNS